ncbi:MAG: hypothetical protein ACFCUR_03975 [Rhodomicrobiaceae bacterium]
MAVPPVDGQQPVVQPSEEELNAAFESAVASVMQVVAMSSIMEMGRITSEFMRTQKENREE